MLNYTCLSSSERTEIFSSPISSGNRSLSIESNDLTFILNLEASQILYKFQGFTLGSVQIRIFFQSWIFIGRTDAEAETPILWLPDSKNWLIGKDPDAGKGWRWEEKGTTEDEMVGWHHWLDGHEFEQAPGVGEGQGSLACFSPWVAETDTTELLNWLCPCQCLPSLV